ncbi:hypothetical protein EYF80_039083 [Liparis tanakae]|uniref:Uncharacterized protein n=1 Tax=Liparis tanakae TaxID=230148 RepID=A0A4Z2GD96_9TELE|nr:hypothetical protein EYF80_039083 [Liparis tanakae]
MEEIRTWDTEMGFRHVCPPAVKLHITSMVSAAQPRFGSIQYVPIRAGLSRVPSGFFRLWIRVLRCCKVLKISVPWSSMSMSMPGELCFGQKECPW